MRPNSSVPPQPKASTPSLRTTSALERSLHDGLIANPPPGAPRFDDQVDLAHKQMRTCTFSRTADGMQTQESFIQYLEQLDREITAHSDAAVAAGGEPIERPVVLCLDNHASRYSEEVLKAASGQSSRLGIRLFTEEPMTSGFLQSLDQYNARGRAGSGARHAGPRRVCARSGHALPRASRSCWATTPPWTRRRARRERRQRGSFLGARCNGRCDSSCVVWGTAPVLGVIGVIRVCVRMGLMRKNWGPKPLVTCRYVSTRRSFLRRRSYLL